MKFKKKKNCLKPICQNIKQKLIYGFDIETEGKDNNFLMGSVASKEGVKVFWDKYDLLEYMFTNPRIKRHGIIFATNLYFDLFNTFKHTDLLEELEVIFINGKLIHGKFKISKNERLEFYDTLSFCHFGVQKMGDLIGLPKLVETGKSVMGRKNLTEDERNQLERYNIRDSEITYKFGEYLQNTFNHLGTNMKLTISSTALNLFKQKYLTTKIYQCPKNLLLKLFDGYYGARTETFIRGYVEKLNYFDINSLYPSVMIKEYPHASYYKYLSKGCNKTIIDEYEGVSHVKMYVEGLKIPYLPVRYNNKLIFPLGDIEGWFTHFEIRKAIELGYELRKINETIFYTREHTPFKEYVETLYKKRIEFQKENNPMEKSTKDLMNHLYGKLGQGIKDVETIKHVNQVNSLEDLYKYDKIDRVNDYFFLKEKVKKQIPTFVNPIYSIYTTAYGRTVLYDYINKVQKAKKDIFYTDTDSLITNYDFDESSKLGKLKKEFSIKEGYIVKPKFYGFLKEDNNSSLKIKGIKQRGCDLITDDSKTVEEFKDYQSFRRFILSKKNLGFRFETFSKFKSSVRSGNSFNHIYNIEKFLSMEDNKRVWEKKFSPHELQYSKPLIL